ncbi:MAG: FecCD family ABC transporter permease [Gemmatimonadaceae bacterium]
MRPLPWIMLALALLIAAFGALAVGAVDLSLGEVWQALWGRDTSSSSLIVRGIRAPRVVLGMLVGAGLAMSGAALQGVLRNSLADPYLLGVSGGAAVGAVLAVALGTMSPGLVALAGFAGAVAAVALVLLLAGSTATPGDVRVLVLAGLLVGAFANAAVMVALVTAPADAVRSSLWWMMGSLGSASWRDVAWTAPMVVTGGFLLVHWARAIDLLALGEDAAAALGVDSEGAARRVFLAASLLAAATVVAAGLVGFVGLVVPNLVRRSAGGRHRPTLLAAALAGAALVLIADVLARTARAPLEVPLGAVTALVGVPFFFVRLRRRGGLAA